ncbi:HlyD family type I secretion periplasmic adaptor subunit [uncultured Desulfobulbus sp.]|uniref:HlyD family type I secretion periplasmic adaptor subunit n=1 Tax=uncultured Desulfobulbus sp. TaxID=239745 RepID=UPI0029C6CC8E|nr:HlyD family type I secretion periplasmic adaptor subunit [uncultured Desulfobulbus sp.]
MAQKNADTTRQLRILSQSAMLEEARTPYLIRTTTLIICLCFICFVIWSAYAQITERATTAGTIIPSGYVQTIQHLEGGIVERILVHDDDRVHKGQILIQLRGDEQTRDVNRLANKLQLLNLQTSRLKAFLSGDHAAFERLSKENSEAGSAQKDILISMSESQRQEQEVLKQQIIQKREQVNLHKRELATAREGLRIAGTAFATQDKLYKERLVSETTYLAVLRDRNEQQGKVDTLVIRISQAEDLIDEFEGRLQSLVAEGRNKALHQLETVEADRAETSEMLEKIQLQAERLAVRSPLDGIVKGLEIHTEGGVIQSGHKLMEIVPTEGEIFAEVRISPNDIGHIKVGYPVIVKISSYDFTRYGSVDGTVKGLSATTFVDEKGQSFYRGVITMEKNYLGEQPGNNMILPGMIVNADIITGTKSLLEYFLKPIHRALNSAFTER